MAGCAPRKLSEVVLFPIKRARGFTLIEVLVALVILALALSAATRAAGAAAVNAETLRSRVLALWVAENELSRLRLAGVLPPMEGSTGTEQQGGRTFNWRAEVAQTPNPSFRRVSLKVFAQEDPDWALANLTGYVTGAAP